jgi:hypothetical protein
MKLLLKLLVLLCLARSQQAFSQAIKDGEYIFWVRDAEYIDTPIWAKVNVTIKGNKIKVVYIKADWGNSKPGDLYEEGILMYNKKNKCWIIGHKASDKSATEVGGCSDGPTRIDLKRKVIWSC